MSERATTPNVGRNGKEDENPSTEGSLREVLLGPRTISPTPSPSCWGWPWAPGSNT